MYPYKEKLRPNKFKHSTAAGMYCTAQYLKVKFCITYLSISNKITHLFYFNDSVGGLAQEYDMT